MQTATFNMPALFGDHHVTEVRRILCALPGILEVYASSAFHVVQVEYDGEKINDLQIAMKLDEAGYLGEWTMPMELERAAPRAGEGQAPFFRHTAVYETLKQTVSFAQHVNYEGRPLWPCPGMGTLSAGSKEESEDAKKA